MDMILTYGRGEHNIGPGTIVTANLSDTAVNARVGRAFLEWGGSRIKIADLMLGTAVTSPIRVPPNTKLTVSDGTTGLALGVIWRPDT